MLYGEDIYQWHVRDICILCGGRQRNFVKVKPTKSATVLYKHATDYPLPAGERTHFLALSMQAALIVHNMHSNFVSFTP